MRIIAGDDCQLDSFVIANKHVWIRAKSNISPVAPFAVAPGCILWIHTRIILAVRNSQFLFLFELVALSRALYQYDLGASLSALLR
jgi:hypothetical protein